jgi:hypothetical protein
MAEQEYEKLRDSLKNSLTPMNTELQRDLWPQMLRLLDERSSRATWFAVLFSRPAVAAAPWFDWALLAVLILAVCIFPNSIPIWLYHL